MTRESAEKFQIKYGWTPKTVLSMTKEQIEKMNNKDFNRYSDALLCLCDDIINITSYLTENGINQSSLEDEQS